MKLRGLLPLFLLAACTGDPTGIDPGNVVMTVSVDENAAENVTVRVRNQGDRTLYVVNTCGSIIASGFERREGGRWVDAPYGLVCFAAYTPPVELAPGESVSGSIAIDDPGRYRSTVRVGTRQDADEFARVREEFTVGS